MKHARSWHTLTLLANGTVLAAGGFGSMSAHGPSNPLSSAELYDPATGRWAWTGSMK